MPEGRQHLLGKVEAARKAAGITRAALLRLPAVDLARNYTACCPGPNLAFTPLFSGATRPCFLWNLIGGARLHLTRMRYDPPAFAQANE